MTNRRSLLCLAILLGSTFPSLGATYSGLRYGNWGGPGYSNGFAGGNPFGSAAAVDTLDAACRDHDRAYASADATFGPRFDTARLRDRPRIRVQWIAAYVRANNQLRGRAQALPALRVYPDGTDSWGGRSIPATVAHRIAYRVGVETVIYLPPR